MAIRAGISWLASSSAAITQARGVIDALRLPGVIDELGFLMLNGAFAERLYPGVTTIMTRARYLVFIPAIYSYLEQSGKALGKDVDRVARDLQFDLRNALEKNETSFIGKEGGRNLIRVPSGIYWSALGALGMATQRLSEASYQRKLSEGLFGMHSYKDDDGTVHDEEGVSLWASALKLSHILSDGAFPATTDFKLRRREALLLESRYGQLAPGGHENLVTRMLSLAKTHGPSSLSEIDYPWNVPGCSPEMMAILGHGMRLSLLARGVTLQYYVMLLEKRNEADPGVGETFVEWWEYAKPELMSWDLEDFFRVIAAWGAGRGLRDRQFIQSWVERSVALEDGRTVLIDRTARQIVGRREDHVRPGKQRLRVKHQLDAWKLPDGFSATMYFMDYRHRVGRQIASDIADGLDGGCGMILNPSDRKNWQGFLDLLQPPTGYRVAGALGTTFGLSMEALTAALLAMCDADGEELAGNPVAATIAITRMKSKFRVLVHPATITGPAVNAGTNRFIALLDRLILEVQPTRGLFHPKVWALRFEHIGAPKSGRPALLGRVLVGSRNLTDSTCFELAATFEGSVAGPGAHPSQLAGDIKQALSEWLAITKAPCPEAVSELPGFIGGLVFDAPQEAGATLRLRWQGERQAPLARHLPKGLRRAVLVAPFIQPAFVTELLNRTETLHVVSIPESLDALPDDTIAALNARAAAQKSPVLYQVTGHGNPDDIYIEGIHAKLLVTETTQQVAATFVGSANATGPGWGIGDVANVEAMVEMRPGLGIDQFAAGFIRESKTKVHPWVAEYDRSAKGDPDPEMEAKRHILAALREVAKVRLRLSYDTTAQQLTIAQGAGRRALPEWTLAHGLSFAFVPLMLADTAVGWRPVAELERGPCTFDKVPPEQVSAFVALRARSIKPPLERRRFVLATLDLDHGLLDIRDEALRKDILAHADPAMVLNTLVRGLSYVQTDGAVRLQSHAQGEGLQRLLTETTLERLLQAVAVDPALVSEIRSLLGPIYGRPVLELCQDLDEALQRVFGEGVQ